MKPTLFNNTTHVLEVYSSVNILLKYTRELRIVLLTIDII